MDMITTSYTPVPISETMPQLQGPWALARGLELPTVPPVVKQVGVLSSAVLAAYHGVRRNHGSIFWGVVWFGLGAIFPVLTPIVSVGQGFARPRPINCPSTQTAGLLGAALCRSRRKVYQGARKRRR